MASSALDASEPPYDPVKRGQSSKKDAPYFSTM
jgi:hypothetical protein